MNGIYIHLPFCIKKCDYCDFASTDKAFSHKEDYIDAIICEMKEYSGASADTVYFGGGTPTSLPISLIKKLIFSIKEIFSLTKDAEITIECNPKTADAYYFNELISCGFNRISIGVQSFCDDELSFLGRAHTAQDAVSAITDAKNAGFDNISADLMFGFFNQTTESVLYSLSKMTRLPVTHISCYSLIIEENTPFGKRREMGENLLMPEETERALYKKITEFLQKNGFSRYEISNYAKDGFFSRHNKKYWDRDDYIGLGAAAHSFYKGYRFSNPDDICEYINFAKNSLPKVKEKISADDAIFETIFLGLRKACGISKSDFYNKFGKKIDDIFPSQISELSALGLLVDKGDRLYLTDNGIDVSNEIFVKFLK